MIKYIAIVLFLLLSFLSAHASGPPVREDGTITTEHISIKIDSFQVSQVEKTHIIELSPSQHSILKKYYKNCPKKFVVVTPHYNDCTCDLSYLIWNKTDTIVLPLDSIDYFKESSDNKDYYQRLLKNWTKQKIIIDTNGNLYYEGKSLSMTGLENLLKNIATREDRFARWIFISLPPYLDTSYQGYVEAAINKIVNIAEKYNVNAQIGG
jgi:hypothetical protein